MIILLEAVDGCGKTTLANKLCKTYNAKYIHVSKPKTKNPFLEYVQLLSKLSVKKNYIFDRCFHGERAYGPHFRGKDGLSDEKQFYLEMLIMKHNPRLVYCWQGHNEIASVYVNRGEKFTKLEDVPSLERLYEKTLEKSKIGVLRYRWSTDSYETVKRFIEQCPLNLINLRINLPCPDLVGHLKPDILFIGDSKNPKLAHLPVFCSTSGMFLMRVLKDMKLKFAIVNSVNNNKILTWKEIYKINPKKVVFLGKNSYSRLVHLINEFPSAKVVHPQLAKRFYGRDAIERYTAEIMEAIT